VFYRGVAAAYICWVVCFGCMLGRLLAPLKALGSQSGGVVVGLGGFYFAPEYPQPSFSVYVDWYRRDPAVMAAADFVGQAVAGVGGYTTSDDPEAKGVVDDFNEEVNLDEVHLQAATWSLLCGNFFLERVYSEYTVEAVADGGVRVELTVPAEGAELVGLKPIPLTSIASVQRDRFGSCLLYTSPSPRD